MRALITRCLGAVLAGALPLPALAAGLDGTQPVTCTIVETADCGSDAQCIRDTPESVNLPRLIRIDFAAKRIVSRLAGGDERTAEIGLQRVEDGKLLLQGIQRGHAWSAAILQDSGALSLAIAGEGGAVAAFGFCAAF
jgi:hypothetical protein